MNGSKEVLCGAGPRGGHHVPTFVAVGAGRLSDVQRAGLEHLTTFIIFRAKRSCAAGYIIIISFFILCFRGALVCIRSNGTSLGELLSFTICGRNVSYLLRRCRNVNAIFLSCLFFLFWHRCGVQIFSYSHGDFIVILSTQQVTDMIH